MLPPAATFVHISAVLQEQSHYGRGDFGQRAGTSQSCALVIIEHIHIHAQLKELNNDINGSSIHCCREKGSFVRVCTGAKQLFGYDYRRIQVWVKLVGVVNADIVVDCLRPAMQKKPQFSIFACFLSRRMTYLAKASLSKTLYAKNIDT